MMFVTRGDGYLTTAQAAGMVRVEPGTIRQWKRRGHLDPVGLDERGHPLYRPEDVTRAEKRVHDNGLRTNGTDPRRSRKSARDVLAAEALTAARWEQVAGRPVTRSPAGIAA
jgi:DNA-binding transcriptional MerR regulator